MAVNEGRPLVMEMEREEYDFNEACGCGCFRVFNLKWWKGHHEEEGKRLLEQKGEGRNGEETWMVEKLRKMKEVSEVVAGPKWKTFIRKISGYVKKHQKNNNRFQYDEHSYALNFNSGAQSENEDYFPPSFSSRFSAPLSAARATK